MYYVYILRCSDNSLYTGITTDVSRRFSEHRSGTGAKYTRMHTPIEVAAAFSVGSKSDALRIECAIKKLSKLQKEQLICGIMDIDTFFDVKIERISV